ncbi:MAG: hypothetical protein HZA50_09350 [Planctomycetes bacterium]|nr:hypothetical protein [Planctomycetota bacterium]
MKAKRIGSVILAAALGLTGLAMAAKPPEGAAVPVEKLITDVTTYINDHAKDANGYYTLGRIHFLAFSEKTTSLLIDHKGDVAQTLPRVMPPIIKAKVTPPTEEQLIAHVREALANIRKAIEMDGKNGLYHMELASILERGAEISDKIGLIPGDTPAATELTLMEKQRNAIKIGPLIEKLGSKDMQVRDTAAKELRAQIVEAMPHLLWYFRGNDAKMKTRVKKLIEDYWTAKAVPSYLEAYKLAIAKDLEIQNIPLDYPSGGLYALVSYKAGKSYIHLVGDRGETDAEKELLAKMEKDLETLEKKPPPSCKP